MTESNELKEPESHRVRFDPDKKDVLIIDGLEVKDSPELIELARQKQANGEDLESLVLELLEIGAKAASVFSSNAGAETIKNALENAKQGIGSSLTSVTQTIASEMQTLTAEDGNLNQTMTRVMDKFAADVTASISGENAPVKTAIVESVKELQGGLKESIDTSLKIQREGIERLLDPENSVSPLRGFRTQLVAIEGIVRDLKGEQAIEIAEDALKDNAPIGGVEYEKRAVDALIAVVNKLGDTCESTGATEGFKKRSKKGDAVAEFNTSIGQKVRIVAEAKDSALTIKEWRKEMTESRENRQAEGFIGLCKSPSLMPNVGQRVWIDDMKSVVIAFDPEHEDPELLRSIYQFVKLTSMTRSGELGENQAAKLLNHINSSIATIEKFNEANRNLTGLETSTKSLRTILGDIRTVLERELVEAQKTIIGYDQESKSIGEELESEEFLTDDEIL